MRRESFGLAPAAGPPSAEPRAQWFDPHRLSAEQHARWDALARAAGPGSAFAQPWFVCPSLAHFDPRRRVRLAVIADAVGAWLGAIALIGAGRYGRAPFPHWAAWRHANQFVGAPLVRTGEELRFWNTLLPLLDRAARWRCALRLAALPLDDAVTVALLAHCRAHGRGWQVDRAYARPALMPGTGAVSGIAALAGDDRRRIASLQRKLAREHGAVSFVATSAAAELPRLAAEFLALEHAGWKGAGGSSLASTAPTRDFFADLIAAAAHAGALDTLALCAGGRTIALSVHFRRGDHGCGFKMAYDPAFARYAPGVLLLAQLTARFGELGLATVDSCADPDQQPLARLWPGRRELVDGRVALGGAPRRAAFAALGRAEAVWHEGKHRLRREAGGAPAPA